MQQTGPTDQTMKMPFKQVQMPFKKVHNYGLHTVSRDWTLLMLRNIFSSENGCETGAA